MTVELEHRQLLKSCVAVEAGQAALLMSNCIACFFADVCLLPLPCCLDLPYISKVLIAPIMDYLAEQEMEIEALQAILMEDLTGKLQFFNAIFRNRTISIAGALPPS